MRRLRLIAVFLLLCLTLSSCTTSQQLENQAFVILLGIDEGENGEIELTVQIPKIGGKSSGSESGGSGGSSYMVAATSGETFSEALELLSVAVPRRINLTQVKLIAVSEKLAQGDKFRQLLWEISETYQLYGTAHMVVCIGKAGEFIQNQEPVIGARVSTAIIALLDHYKEQGYIPESTFADVYYRTNSLYGDPLVILAGSGADENEPVGEIPPEILPDEVPAKIKDDKNEYLGAAVMKNGIMVGTLTAGEMLFANLIRGRQMKFDYTLEEKSMSLTPEGAAKITVDTKSNPTRITFEQTLLAIPLTEMPDIKELENSLEEKLTQVVEKCQELGVDPFFFAERAVGEFLTIEDWKRFGWEHHFSRADIRVNIHVRRIE